jgi:hypothetical protein
MPSTRHRGGRRVPCNARADSLAPRRLTSKLSLRSAPPEILRWHEMSPALAEQKLTRWHTLCTQPGDVVAALDTASPVPLRDARKLVIVSRPHQAARSTGADPPGLQTLWHRYPA